jgi:3-methyladenine DNA glycosylase Mpg
LCEAFDIDRSLDGWDLTRGKQLWICDAPQRRDSTPIAVSPRIGVTSAQELPLRFYLQGCAFVSR